MESTNQNKQAENEIGKHLQTLEIYIKEGGKEKGTVSGDMAITSLSIIENYIIEYFFCKDFEIKPTLSSANMKGKNAIWGKPIPNPELVNKPPHYTSGGLEVIDIIEAFNLGFHLGNAIKYILRAGRKSFDVDVDIKKSIWYLNRFLNDSIIDEEKNKLIKEINKIGV